jgi:Zn-dependent protease with chaperone function
MPVSPARSRRFTGAIATTAFVAVSLLPSAAEAYRDKPKIPKEPVLSVYTQTLAAEKLAAIAPVSTGLAALTQGYSERSLQDPQLNPDMYRGTIDILRQYLRLIAQKGPRKDVVPRVELVRSDMINGKAESQEVIVLTTGLVDRIAGNIRTSDANVEQLLFTLAHEYAHVLYDHPRRFSQKVKPVGVAKLLGTALVVAGVVNNISASDGKGGAIDPKAIGAIQVAFALSPLIELEIYRAAFAPYKKEQESIADFAAVDLMDALKVGDPRQACTWLLDLDKYDDSLKAQLKSGLKRMGNNFKASMAVVAVQAPGLLMQEGPKAVLEQAQKNLLRAALVSAVDFLGRRFDKKRIHLYYSADKRVDAIKAYANKFFPAGEQQASLVTQSAWASQNNVPNPTRLVDTFEREHGPDKAASAAKLRLIENDVAGARSILDAAKARFVTLSRALAPEPAPAKPAPKGKGKGKGKGKPAKAAPAPPPPVIASAYFHIIDGQTYMAEGRIEQAAMALNLATLQPVAPLSAFQMLASAQSTLGRNAAVLATLDRAAAIFGEQQVILLRIRHYVATSNRAKAEEVAARCAQFGDLAQRCQEALPLLDKNEDRNDDDGDAADDSKAKARPKKGQDDDDD